MVHTVPPSERDLILAHILKKSREFVLTHPEIRLNKAQKLRFEKLVSRRENHEPLAYILGRKEFYGLDFKVDKNTLIPRPETELLVEEVMRLNPKNCNIIDIGTGSGNIVISIAANSEQGTVNRKKINYFATDISAKALQIAKQNARKHKVKIKFIKTDILKYFIDHCSLITGRCIIVANLPYLSEKIYSDTEPDVKNFEPKSALLSGKLGLDHYEKLFQQVKEILSINDHCSLIIEISPEQKMRIIKIIKKYLPDAAVVFQKDLSGKWRLVKIEA